MCRIDQFEKLLKQCYCYYKTIPRKEEVFYLKKSKKDPDTGNIVFYSVKEIRYSRSNEQWDFINSAHHHFTRTLSLCDWKRGHFIDYFEANYPAKIGRKISKKIKNKEKRPTHNYKEKKEISQKERIKREWRKYKKDRRDRHIKKYGNNTLPQSIQKLYICT